MVLISHIKKFIFFKTKKTASTTIENYFTKFCIKNPNSYIDSHDHDELVTKYGVIGRRINGKITSKYKFHVTTKPNKIRTYLGIDKFNNYLKFTIIRNPWDKMVSLFFFIINLEPKNYKLLNIKQWKVIFLNKKKNKVDNIQLFREWINLLDLQTMCIDWEEFTLNNKPCCDYYIHFENLETDTKILCNKLGINFSGFNKSFKTNYRKDKDYKKYYDNYTKNRVQQGYKLFLEYFPYKFD